LLETVARLDLVDHIAPVQWGLRLLITHGSRLLELDDVAALVRDFDATSLTYPWRHADARVDLLQKTVANLVGVRATATRAAIFAEIASLVSANVPPQRARAAIPYLDEPWYC
jgi:hypothetical protein